MNYLLDTNTVGWLLQQKNFQFSKKLKANDNIYISVITIVEFLSNSNLTESDKDLFEQFIIHAEVLDILSSDMGLIKETIKLRKKYKLRLPDALIAAQAITSNLILVTGDADFAAIYQLKIELVQK
ncbi:MAG: PIN domain-containing protein [Chitinophagaceae bacterium]|nr:PIN domain-containing protein [Chitinophagaceae bacterium]MCW5906204.1 PIN domain-containing protein [Chitinophagaceae bacterium]